jgi:hypothetical protein
VELQIRPIRTSALDRGDCLCHGRFTRTPLEKVPGTHWLRSWVDPTAYLKVSEKVPSCWQVSNFGSPGRKLCTLRQVIVQLTDVGLFRDFPKSFHVNAGIALRSGHDWFLSTKTPANKRCGGRITNSVMPKPQKLSTQVTWYKLPLSMNQCPAVQTQVQFLLLHLKLWLWPLLSHRACCYIYFIQKTNSCTSFLTHTYIHI